MHLIGILGRSRVGKDTVATLLQEMLQPKASFRCVSIAESLKKAVQEQYDFHESQLYGEGKDTIDLRYQRTPRELCQAWERHVRFLHGESFLVRRMFQPFDEAMAEGGVPPRWVVCDVRYPHDCHEIRQRGGVVWKVTRPHASVQVPAESHIDHMYAEFTLSNHRDISHLRERICALLAKS